MTLLPVPEDVTVTAAADCMSFFQERFLGHIWMTFLCDIQNLLNRHPGAWVYPFVGPDKHIMRRTERARHLLDGERPAQVETYSIAPFGLISGKVARWL